jgi:CRISPR-associated endonuclease Cas2
MPLYLISYDIACHKRRIKVHKLLTGKAFTLQLSVFLFDGDKPQLMALLSELAAVANKVEDNIICLTVDINAFYRKFCGMGQQGFYIEHGCQLLNELLN